MPFSQELKARLSALRRTVGAWLMARGLSVLLLWVVGILALSLLTDWYFDFDKPQRLIFIVVTGIVLVSIFYRKLLRPLSRQLDDDTLALRVEDTHRELGEGFISALQFSRIEDPAKLGMSPQMVQATIASGSAAAEKVSFKDVVDRKAFTRNLAIIAAMVVVLGVGAGGVFAWDIMNIWFKRMFLLGDARYPRATHFDLDEATEIVVPRGDDWTASALVTGEIPDFVYIEFKPRNGPEITQMMTRQDVAGASAGGAGGAGGAGAEGAKEGRFAAVFKNVLEPFRFRISGGDNRTRWINARLVDRPGIESFDLTLRHPQYTALEPEVVWSIRPAAVEAGTAEKPAEGARRAGSSSVYALKGSTIAFTALTNKPLKSAKLRIEKSVVDLAFKPAKAGDREVSQIDVELAADKLVAGTYAIEMTDTEGMDSKKPTRFLVRLRPDKDPVVRAELVGVSSMVVSDARIPLKCNFKDDFAITQAGLSFQFRGESEDAPKGSDRVPFAEINAGQRLTDKGLDYLHNWEIGSLKIPVGSSLTFQVDASDNDTVTGPKHGKSTAFFARVVTEEELRQELIRREQEQRQEFERLIKTQEDLIAESRIVMAGGLTESTLSGALRQKLLQNQQRQKQVGDRCKAIHRQYDLVRMEYLNNKLDAEDGPVIRVMQANIIDALQRISVDCAALAAGQIEQSRKINDTAARQAVLQEVITQQMKIAGDMRDVLLFMRKWSSYQEAVNLLYQVVSVGDKIDKDIFKAAKARLEATFSPRKDEPRKEEPKKDGK